MSPPKRGSGSERLGSTVLRRREAPSDTRSRTRSAKSGRSPKFRGRWETAARAAQVLLGLVSVGFGIIVLAQPELSLTGLLLLLAEAVVLLSAQTVLAGGRLLFGLGPDSGAPGAWWRTVRSWGIVGVGLLAIALTAFAVLDPALAIEAAVFLLALALVSQGIGWILSSGGLAVPRWLRTSSLGTGLLTLVLVALSVASNGFALAAFGLLVGVILVISGIESIVSGLHPTDPRQFVLLKLVLFSSFYGLILINWIDLFGKSVPGYGIWLILTYMAPFGVVLVFQGWKAWPLATSLGLLVSLNNDLGYYFVGNLIFGFHQPLGPWLAGQLGFLGGQIVTVFQGGRFTLDVTSWMMGLSIYARALIVAGILLYWWRHPGEIVARSAQPDATAVS